jgi:hypothetical protein
MAGDQIAMPGVNLRRLLPLLLLVIVIAGNLFTAVRHLSDLPIADEPQFYDMGKSIWQTGLPYAYSGDLWHPMLASPLLHYHLLALISPLPLGYWGPRLLGLLLFAGGLMLALAAARRLGKGTAVWVAILMLAPPLAAQGALLVDMDGGLMVFLTALWAYIWLMPQKTVWHRRIILAAIITLGLCTKLLVPTLLCAGTFIAGMSFRRRVWIKDSLFAFITGVILFAIIWFIYTTAWQLDFWGPFIHGASKMPTDGFGSWALAASKGLIRIALWLTPLWLLLACLPRHLGYEETPLFFAGWLILAVHAGLGITAYGFPKYFPPMIPLLAIGLAPAIQSSYERIKQFIPLLILSIISLILPLLLGDPLLPILTANRMGMDASSLLTSAICLTLPLLLTLAFWLWQRTMAMLRMALLCGAVGLGAGIMIVQGMADYEVRYIYGERGMQQLLTELEKNVPAGSEAILPVDVAFLSGYRYQFRQAESALQNDAPAFATLISDPSNQAVVLRESYYAHAGYDSVLKDLTIIQILEREYKTVKVGSFSIYHR